ncbi:MAG: hypothetical protein NC548_66055, partial [Lachnospiraceae bacterium]|nr:hypothetical protein [Lachnospiraceae bacterium]
VSTRLITAINPSIVNIHLALLPQEGCKHPLYSLSGFYVSKIHCIWRGTPYPVDAGFAPAETKCRTQSLRRGLTAYHPGSPKQIFPQFGRKFNIFLPSVSGNLAGILRELR